MVICIDYECGEAQLDGSECGNASGLQPIKVGQCYPTADQTLLPTCSHLCGVTDYKLDLLPLA